MTKQNFSKKDLHRLEEKHVKELLATSLFSRVDEVDMNILSSVEELLYELGFEEYLHCMSRLQRLADYEYTEDEYYNKNFPYEDNSDIDYQEHLEYYDKQELCSGCHSYDCNGECMGE